MRSISQGIRLSSILVMLTAPLSFADQPLPNGSELLTTAQPVKAVEASKLGSPVNWVGTFAPCDQRSELLKRGPMNLGVRLSTSNANLARQFKKAMNFWARVIDMRWHEEDTSSCAVQLVDGTPSILTNAVVARSQFTDWGNFQGWIAFDAKAPLTKLEMFVTAVHEIGHMLGLKHNPSAQSVMYYLDLEGVEVLDTADLSSLATHHKMRIESLDSPIAVSRPAL